MKFRRIVSGIVSAATFLCSSSQYVTSQVSAENTYIPAGNGYSAGEIEASPVKPKLNVSAVTVNPETEGNTVYVDISVSGANEKYCATGISFFYDSRLEISRKDSGGPDIERGEATKGLQSYLFSEERTLFPDYNRWDRDWGSVFLCTSSAYSSDGKDGLMYRIKFILPSDAQPGDVYPLDICYIATDYTADIFKGVGSGVNPDDYSELMEAYLFTRGIYNEENPYISPESEPDYVRTVMNGSPYDGYIAIREDEEITTTTTTTAAATTTTTATTTSSQRTTITTSITTTQTTSATTTTASPAVFKDGINNWSFLNSRTNFGNTYFIKSSYYDKLLNGLRNTEKKDVINILADSWGGSCYGLATTSILSCYGILNPADWYSDAVFLHDIPGPPDDDIESLINYYYALQMTDEVYQYTAKSFYETEKTKVNRLVSCLEDESPTLLTFFQSGWGGHAVVAYKTEYGAWVKSSTAYNGRALIYDNNAGGLNEDYCIYFNTANGSWTIPHYGLSSAKGSTLGMITDDLGVINYHGYLSSTTAGHTDDYIAILSSKAIAADYSIKKVSLKNGTWMNADTSEDEIKIFAPYNDGDYTNSDIKFALLDSQNGYSLSFSSPEALDMTMRYEDTLMEASYSSADSIVFSPSGYIDIAGNTGSYDLSIITNDDLCTTDWYDMEVSGSSKGVSFHIADGGYILSGDTLKNVTVKAKNDDVSPSVTFSTEYDEVFIYEIDVNTIGISVDTDNNGTYETQIKAQAFKYGDSNADGKVNIADAIAVLQYTANAEKYPLVNADAADCDGTPGITGMDAIAIQMLDAGTVSSLPLKV